MKNTKTIVFIHGLFVNNTSWSAWKTYFEAKGYRVYAPANPGHDGAPASLRSNTHPQLAQTGFEAVVMHMARLIDTLPEKPIVVGHSLAGLVVQKLVEMDKVVAGVSIDGAPPKNVLAPFPTIKMVLPVVNPFAGGPVFMGSKSWYHKAFFNNYTRQESDRLYEEIAVPESRKIARDTLLKSFATIDFKKPHNPLLFIGGEKDQIFPAAFTRKIAGSYRHKNSTVVYKAFTGRSHFICGEKDWEEVAEYVLNWIQQY